jgi:F-type H+-transporting ATPase subunit delta
MTTPAPHVDSVMTGTHMSLSRAYAEALLLEAEEGGKGEEITAELESLVDALETAGATDDLMRASLLSGPDRCEFVRRVFHERMSDLGEAFLVVLARRNRMILLRAIVGQLRRLVELGTGKIEVTVTTPVALSDDAREDLVRGLQGAFGADPILTEFVDDSLLGGILVQVGDRIYDASVSGELKRLSESLAEGVTVAGVRPQRQAERWP